jgi:hypothetical protein
LEEGPHGGEEGQGRPDERLREPATGAEPAAVVAEAEDGEREVRRERPPVQHPEGEPWVLVRDVLAEYYGREPNRGLDDEARTLAADMRGVRADWCGRPAITWSAAKLLLESKVAERLRVATERAERLARSDVRRPPEPVVAAGPKVARFPREYW